MSREARLPEAVRRELARVRTAGAVTGAGVSAGAGLPTYRGRGGIYDDPEAGDRTVEDLSVETLHRDPDRTWRRLTALARAVLAAEPGPAHRALARLERTLDRFALLTQNVDRLHHRAGSSNVIDIHGDLTVAVCGECGARAAMAGLVHLERAPGCERCGGLLRADVVLFGEMLPLDKVRRIHEELVRDPPDLVLVAGTSALFPYIVEPVMAARERGRLTVEVNPEATILTGRVDFALAGPADELLPAIADEIERARGRA